MKTSRRDFIASTFGAAAGATLLGPAHTSAKTTQPDPEGFFTLGKRKGRWFFIDPADKPFFSVALNHIDSSTLRYPENTNLWDAKYGNDQIRWIKESVAPNLRRWGFNSVGWVQETTIRRQAHTPNFTFEQYQALDMPYCHLLPFAETHQWNPWHKNPNFFTQEFEDWCDYVARNACGRMKNDRKLIGYFYVDCPTWVHCPEHARWRGPLFNPEKLETESGRKELLEMAGCYYRVTHDAIRRYDRHHLILGDRYEANAPLPMEVVEAARPYVDVLCFQDFRQPVEHLAQWHAETGMPVLWADGARSIPVKDDTGRYRDGQYGRNDGRWYADVLAGLRENPGCVGAHLCGAYLRNRFRKRGLLDEQERPDEENLTLIAEANLQVQRWAQTYEP